MRSGLPSEEVGRIRVVSVASPGLVRPNQYFGTILRLGGGTLMLRRLRLVTT